MRRHTFRALVLAGALAALSVPVFSATQNASACSNPGCSITVPIGGVPIDTYFSPISITASSATFAEYQLTGEQTSLTLPGSLSVSVADLRGNNQGWDLSVSSTGFSSSLSSVSIPGSDLSVTGVTSTLTSCVGVGATGCSTIQTVTSGMSATLDMNPIVAVACPAEAVGLGYYDIGVNMNLNLSGQAAEVFTFAPASWYGNFSVTVNEGTSFNPGTDGCGSTVGGGTMPGTVH